MEYRFYTLSGTRITVAASSQDEAVRILSDMGLDMSKLRAG